MCHHSKHLMGYFEFLPGSRIIYLLLNISEKLHWQHLFGKLEEGKTIVFIFVNTMQYPHTLKNNIYHPNKRRTLPFFYSNTNPLLGHIMVHSVDKNPYSGCNNGIVFVVVLSNLFLRYLLSFQSTTVKVTLFFAWFALFKVAKFYFCRCFSQW